MNELEERKKIVRPLHLRETAIAPDEKNASVTTIEQQIGLSFEGLTPEQQQLLRYKLAEAFIEIKKDSISAQNRMVFSNEEMTKTIEKAQELSKSSDDFSIESAHETASGNAKIKVSNFRNISAGGIICIIGIIVALGLLKGC